jgi:hypothetical protein
MGNTDSPNLTDAPRLKEFLSLLPISTPDAAAEMDVAATTVEGYRDRLNETHDVDLSYDREANLWYLADDSSATIRDNSTARKQSITREVTKTIEDEQAYLFRRLRRTDPLEAPPQHEKGRESVGIILGDLHFGDVVEKEFWNDESGQYETQRVYDSEIAADKVAAFTEKALYIIRLLESYTLFDDAHIFLLGDLSTGTHVYDTQWADIDAQLRGQVEQSVSALFQCIRSFAEKFDTVQVRGIPGNHGTDKPSSAIGANTDLLTYGWLDDRLREAGFDNVDFRAAETHHYLNTTVRDWRFHIRHGDEEREHVDETAASARDWRGLQEEFDFDVAMKGHHHSPAFHKVMNRYPVFSAPSPKPGDEFASNIGSPDVSRHSDLGWLFGVGDTRPVTWQFLLDDR